MKLILIALVTAMTTFASAQDEIQTPCTFQNYQALRTALMRKPIQNGSEYIRGLNDLLSQEMGPSCVMISYSKPRFGISGERVTHYRISTRIVQYDVYDRSSRINQNRNFVQIEMERK